MRVLTRNVAALIGLLGMVLGAAPAGSQSPVSESALPATVTPAMRGRVEILEPMPMTPLAKQRVIRVYLPPSYAQSPDRRYGVIYLHDGQNLFDAKTSYAGEWGVDESLDAMAAEGLEWIAVGIDHGSEQRVLELSPWTNARFGKAEGEDYARFVVETLKPYIDARYRTLSQREHTFVMGSSMGGLMSHYLLHRYPDTFAGAGVLSPSYWFSDEIAAFTDAHPLPADARLYSSVGSEEGREMVSGLRKMKSRWAKQPFAAQGLRVEVLRGAEHNEATWRGEFIQALRWLHGGPSPAAERE